ncbi:UDP-N-acetyl glucosamine 2-epimerase [Planctomycetota bacterium]
MKVLSIVGARPQFIKAALVSANLRRLHISEILLHTGQHYDFNMSEVFFRDLNLSKPDYQLDIGSGAHGEQTGRMLMEIEKVLLIERPDFVIVYGDTNTTLAGALAGAKLHIPLAHVESGLRSFNKKMPEEINRLLTDHCSNILLCPTKTAVMNLQREGFTNVMNDGKLLDGTFLSQVSVEGSSNIVVNVGDVMFDAVLEAKELINSRADDRERILGKYFLTPKEYVLTTIHRADSTDDGETLRHIIEALKEIAASGVKIFFPVHPRTKNALKEFDLLTSLPETLILNDPVSYKEMVILTSQAKVIITDSGGLQKEAYFSRIPCIVARDETEWTELLDIGWNKVVGTDTAKIVSAVLASLNEDFTHREWIDFYGGGKAGRRIVEVLKNCAR